jgi:hypothetical protein
VFEIQTTSEAAHKRHAVRARTKRPLDWNLGGAFPITDLDAKAVGFASERKTQIWRPHQALRLNKPRRKGMLGSPE